MKVSIARLLSYASLMVSLASRRPLRRRAAVLPGRAEPVEQDVQVAGTPVPVQLVRTLHLMQDQIAMGSTEAHLGQRGLAGYSR